MKEKQQHKNNDVGHRGESYQVYSAKATKLNLRLPMNLLVVIKQVNPLKSNNIGCQTTYGGLAANITSLYHLQPFSSSNNKTKRCFPY